jgi:hypothetical protein
LGTEAGHLLTLVVTDVSQMMIPSPQPENPTCLPMDLWKTPASTAHHMFKQRNKCLTIKKAKETIDSAQR